MWGQGEKPEAEIICSAERWHGGREAKEWWKACTIRPHHLQESCECVAVSLDNEGERNIRSYNGTGHRGYKVLLEWLKYIGRYDSVPQQGIWKMCIKSKQKKKSIWHSEVKTASRQACFCDVQHFRKVKTCQRRDVPVSCVTATVD